MTPIREVENPVEYSVLLGNNLDGYWGKEIRKRFKKTKHPWHDILESICLEYRFFEIARAQRPQGYTTISSSNGVEYQLVKHWVNIPNLNKSASKAGYRAGLFVSQKDKIVVILFIGHHEDYKQYFHGNENDCFKTMLSKLYPELHIKIKAD